MVLSDTNLEQKYLVFKIDDLTAFDKHVLRLVSEEVEKRRAAQGKKPNEYVVYNLDAPRADEVVAIVEEVYGLRR